METLINELSKFGRHLLPAKYNTTAKAKTYLKKLPEDKLVELHSIYLEEKLIVQQEHALLVEAVFQNIFIKSH